MHVVLEPGSDLDRILGIGGHVEDPHAFIGTCEEQLPLDLVDEQVVGRAEPLRVRVHQGGLKRIRQIDDLQALALPVTFRDDVRVVLIGLDVAPRAARPLDEADLDGRLGDGHVDEGRALERAYDREMGRAVAVPPDVGVAIAPGGELADQTRVLQDVKPPSPPPPTPGSPPRATSVARRRKQRESAS